MARTRILLLEDNPMDARLIEHELHSSQLASEIRRVETRDEFVRALEGEEVDLVLADYGLPGFDGKEALEIVLGLGLGVPFIFVSGQIGEERAIDALIGGATDYVLKDRLARLGPSVRRALSEAAERRKRHEAELALARQTEELRRSRARLQTLTRRLVEVQEDERRSLSRDLHDTSGQAMTALRMGLALLKREGNCSQAAEPQIDELGRVADTVSEDLHRLSVNLRPSSLDRYGLVPALEQLIASVRKQAGIEVEFQVQGMDERLPGDIETALYRIVQEACTNITRYARAASTSVLVQRDDAEVRVIVEDDGRGFDVEEALSRGRLGLLGMQERAEMLGGSLEVESSPGNGATLYVRVPLHGALGADASRDDDGDREDAPGPADALPGPPLVEGQAGAWGAGEAAELARAKALSDALVEIGAGMVRCGTGAELLGLVLGRSAEAIGCEGAAILEREGDHWVISHVYRSAGSLAGRRLSDEAVPAAVRVERTREMAVVNDLRIGGPEAVGLSAEFAALSCACIPLVAGDKLAGVASYLYHSAAIPFRPSEVDFLGRLAGLATLALENVRLRELEDQQRADLAQRVEELQTLLDVLPVGIGIAYDPQCKNIQVNPAFARLLGIAPHANASLSADEPEKPVNFKVLLRGRELAPEELPMQVAAAQGVEVRDLLVDVVRDDGATLTLLEYAAPLRHPDGRPRGSVGAFIDITGEVKARMQAETAAHTLDEAQAALRESEARYRLLFESMEESVSLLKAIYDDQGRPADFLILDMNPAQRKGRRPEDVQGKTLRQLNPNVKEMRIEAYGRVAQTGRPERFVDYSDFTNRWQDLVAYSAGPDLVAVLSKDITERVRLEEELRRTNAELEQRVQERTASLEQATQRLQSLNRRVVEMQERERSYVADQLYNQFGQVLAALQIQLGMLEDVPGQGRAAGEQLAETKAVLGRAMWELHELAGQLRPAGLDRLGLAPALEQYVNSFGREHGLSVRFVAHGVEKLPLPGMVAMAVYRAVLEALENVALHAQATAIAVTLESEAATLVLSVEDDGVGFDPAAVAHGSAGVGLISMRERILSVGGRLSIESQPGCGTRVRIELPVS